MRRRLQIVKSWPASPESRWVDKKGGYGPRWSACKGQVTSTHHSTAGVIVKQGMVLRPSRGRDHGGRRDDSERGDDPGLDELVKPPVWLSRPANGLPPQMAQKNGIVRMCGQGHRRRCGCCRWATERLRGQQRPSISKPQAFIRLWVDGWWMVVGGWWLVVGEWRMEDGG